MSGKKKKKVEHFHPYARGFRAPNEARRKLAPASARSPSDLSTRANMKFCGLLAVSSFAFFISFSEGVTIDIPLEIKENQTLVVNCTGETGNANGIIFFINDQRSSIVPTIIGAVASYQVGTVTRANYRDVFRCDDSLDAPPRFTDSSSPLNVLYNAVVNDLVTQKEVVVGGVFVATFTFDANPPVTDNDVMLLRDNNVLSGERFSVNSTAVAISSIQCGDNATYTLQANNTVGSGMDATFTVPVTLVVASFTSTNIVLPETVDVGNTVVSLSNNIAGCSGGAEVRLSCTMPGGPTLSQTVNTDVSTPVVWTRSDFVTCGLDGGSASLTCTVSNDDGSDTANVEVSYSSAACHDVTCCLAPVLVVVFIAILIIAAVVVIVVVVVLKKKKK